MDRGAVRGADLMAAVMVLSYKWMAVWAINEQNMKTSPLDVAKGIVFLPESKNYIYPRCFGVLSFKFHEMYLISFKCLV